MTNLTVYFRASWESEEELAACENHFHTVRFRTAIPLESLVISRYSMLPFPDELASDVRHLCGRLINTPQEHRYVADIIQYVPDLTGITQLTWSTWDCLPDGMSFVVKGRTNSRKHEWRDRMFCRSKTDVPRVANSLLDDDLIKSQGLVVREYVPLVRLGEGINGLPISNEWRFFVLDGKILDAGFYWASEPDLRPCLEPSPGAIDLVNEAIRRVDKKIRFYAVDVAEKESGGWVVIELNDGCMSGLSMIDPERFYSKLATALT